MYSCAVITTARELEQKIFDLRNQSPKPWIELVRAYRTLAQLQLEVHVNYEGHVLSLHDLLIVRAEFGSTTKLEEAITRLSGEPYEPFDI